MKWLVCVMSGKLQWDLREVELQLYRTVRVAGCVGCVDCVDCVDCVGCVGCVDSGTGDLFVAFGALLLLSL